MDQLTPLLAHQAGVVSRRQVLAAGGDDGFIERMVRGRRWAKVFPGVYVEHTGPLSWHQRAWAAVLYAAPAALAGSSALRAHGLRGHDSQDHIGIVVCHSRKVVPPAGVRVERAVDFDRVTQLHLAPPRVRVEHALLRVASRARTDDGAVAVLSDGCQAGRTTPPRLREDLDHLPRIGRRAFLAELLLDVASGALSALERRYLRDVERAHGFSVGRRHSPQHTDEGTLRRDVEYVEAAVWLELDGRLGHEWAVDRWTDLDRDLVAATSGRLTIRLGWRQVLEPCRLAASLELVLVPRGWTGRARACGPLCPVGRSREDHRHQAPGILP